MKQITVIILGTFIFCAFQINANILAEDIAAPGRSASVEWAPVDSEPEVEVPKISVQGEQPGQGGQSEAPKIMVKDKDSENASFVLTGPVAVLDENP